MPHLENYIYRELCKNVRTSNDNLVLEKEIQRITIQLKTLIQLMIPGFNFPGIDNLSLEKKIRLYDRLNDVRFISNKIKHPKVSSKPVNNTFNL